MSTARDVVLGRIRAALGPSPAAPEIPRSYRAAGTVPPDVDRFCERVADYRATVHRVGEDELAGAVAGLCPGRTAVPARLTALMSAPRQRYGFTAESTERYSKRSGDEIRSAVVRF